MQRDIRPEIRLSVTGKCNYSCRYCSKEGNDSRGYKEITLKQLEELGELIHSLGLPHVHITGGEPTLRKDLEHIIASLKQKGIKNVALTTNGSRLNDKYLDILIQAGLDGLHVHLPSLDREVYRKTAGQDIEPKYVTDITVKTSKRIPTRFNVPVTGINYRYVAEILDCGYDKSISVSLIELMSLDKNLKIDNQQIRELLFNWAGLNRHDCTLEQESERKEAGELYKIGGNRRVRILPSDPNCDLASQNPAHECTIKDNRVWIGTSNERYIYTECMYKPVTKISLEELRVKLTIKYELENNI